MASWTSADTPSFADSSLLRQSPPFRSHRGADSGAIVADLSLSELYISGRSDAVEEEPFSLLPPHANKTTTPQDIKDEATSFNDCDAQVEASNDGDGIIFEKGKQSLNEVRTREERLQHDLFVLKKLNASFSLYNNALKDARSSTENVSMQLERTDRLLNQYVHLLQNTEKNSKLDLEELERIRAEAVSKAEREREELERKAQLEQQRMVKEEEERKIREEREVKELLKKTSIPVRGVRGTRGRVRTVRDVSGTRERASATTSTTGMPNRRGDSGISSRGSSISRGVRRA
ncbi:hypothetical protein BU17DRAFT_77235 [Hysterangium stoloniferum]|nr:hypothetical protein BU17DRAFT_77235 [Hysterangium stoloniferum]